MDKKQLGVVIPVLSAFEEAINCLEQIRTKHIWTPYIAPQWKENKAIASVWNIYATEAFENGCDYAVILNDDAWVSPDAVDNLVNEIETTNALLVSGVSTHIEHDKLRADPLVKSNLNFSCFIISPDTFDKVGLFDENFYPAYFEDNDFHRRMILSDAPAYGITSAMFYHKGSATFNENRDKLNLSLYFNSNKSYYKRKWGGVPGKEKYRTPFNNGGSVKEWTLE